MTKRALNFNVMAGLVPAMTLVGRSRSQLQSGLKFVATPLMQ
jgi:hypothetical protein